MQEKYDVTGMSCAACSARVEKSVAALPGGFALPCSHILLSLHSGSSLRIIFSILLTKKS